MICNQSILNINNCKEYTGSFTDISDNFKIQECLNIEEKCEFGCGDRLYQLIDPDEPLYIQTNIIDTLNTQLTYSCPIGDDEILYEFEVKRIPDSYFGLSNPNPFSWYWDYNICTCPSCYYLNYSLLLSSDLFTNFNDWVVRLTWNLNYLYSGDRQGNICPSAIKELTGNFTNDGNYRIRIVLDKAIYLSCYGQDCDTPWAFCYAYKFNPGDCIIRTKMKINSINNPGFSFGMTFQEVCDGTPIPSDPTSVMPFPTPPVGNATALTLNIPSLASTPSLAAQQMINAYNALGVNYNAYIDIGDPDNVVTFEVPCSVLSACSCISLPPTWYYWYASTFVGMSVENVGFAINCTTRPTPLTPQNIPIHNPFCCPEHAECQFPTINLVDSCCNIIKPLPQDAIIWQGMGTIFNPKLSIQSIIIDPAFIDEEIFGFEINIGNFKSFKGLYKKLTCENVLIIEGLKGNCYLEEDNTYLGQPAQFCSTDGLWQNYNQRFFVEGDLKFLNKSVDNNIINEEWKIITSPIDIKLLNKISSIFVADNIKVNNKTFDRITGSATRIEGTNNFTLEATLTKITYNGSKTCLNC